MQDLWPADIAQTNLRAPVTILKEQAALLGQKTQNIITATVRAEIAHPLVYHPTHSFVFGFYIEAPALDNYHYGLFKISYGIELYPVNFYLDEKIYSEITSSTTRDPIEVEVASEEEFLEILGRILNANKTRQIISALLAQISFEPPEPLPNF